MVDLQLLCLVNNYILINYKHLIINKGLVNKLKDKALLSNHKRITGSYISIVPADRKPNNIYTDRVTMTRTR